LGFFLFSSYFFFRGFLRGWRGGWALAIHRTLGGEEFADAGMKSS
jgi:hypothetical protein